MTALLVRLFVRDAQDVENPQVRGRYGLLSGVVGIVSNFLLFAAKFLVGWVSGSISITADAFNNLSDCASSVITLVGFRLSGMPADDEHPYGHARAEYLTGLAVGVLVLLIGFEFLQSSIEKILRPEPVLLRPLLVVVLAGSILVKLWQSRFYAGIGRRIGSGTLAASSMDSRNDCITTGVVLLGALVMWRTGWNLDGWMGLAVAVFILVSGIGLMKDILNPLLGMAPDPELVQDIEQTIMTYPSVIGVHDLMVHNYGPGRCFASVHVEVPASQDVMASHDIVDSIERYFAKERNIHLLIHMDPVLTDDEQLQQLRQFVTDAALDIDKDLRVHDLRVARYKNHANLIFEVTAPPLYRMGDDELRRQLQERVSEQDRNLRCIITVDRSYTSTTGRAPRG